MKVLVLGTGGAVVSGITTVADEMATVLTRQGVQVVRETVGTLRRKHPNSLTLENLGAIAADAWTVFRRARGERVDVTWLHVFGVPFLPAMRAVLLAASARAAGSATIVHLHAYDLESHLDGAGRLLRLGMRSLALVADDVVVLYEGAAAAVRSAGVANVAVLPNSVEPGRRRRPAPAAGTFVVAFVGALVERKGLDVVLEAADRLRDQDVEFWLIGGGGEDGGRTLGRHEELLANLETDGVVIRLGELPACEVRHALQRANVLVLPSVAEGTPMAVLEAMAESVPVVVSQAGNMASLIEASGAGIVLESRTAAHVAMAIRSLADDRALAGQMGDAARRYSQTLRQQSTEALLALLEPRSRRIRYRKRG